jgi:hypothetical protein
MPRPVTQPDPLILLEEPDPATLPRHTDRRQMACIHTKYFGPISPRSLEVWPLDWRMVNGRLVGDTREFLAEAKRRFDAAPVIRGGRRAVAEQQAA